jgi:hypothetical protein
MKEESFRIHRVDFHNNMKKLFVGSYFKKCNNQVRYPVRADVMREKRTNLSERMTRGQQMSSGRLENPMLSITGERQLRDCQRTNLEELQLGICQAMCVQDGGLLVSEEPGLLHVL